MKFTYDSLDQMMLDLANADKISAPKMSDNNIIAINTFLTTYCSHGTAIRTHLNNMIETYGDQEVLKVIKELFKGIL